MKSFIYLSNKIYSFQYIDADEGVEIVGVVKYLK